MHQRFFDRMTETLTGCAPRSSAAAAFEIKITQRKQPKGEAAKGKPSRNKARLAIMWKRRQSWADWATLSEGCYLLPTNLTESDPATLWKRYIQLTEAEWAFRIEKNELGIRPIWHQTRDRVLGHILVCFLAYVLWKALAQWMRRSGLGDAPRTLLEEFAKIRSGDVVLPAPMADGRRRTIRLRCVTTPDPAQEVLLDRLGLTYPCLSGESMR